MGRRAVRKPDPAVDLSRHLLSLEQLCPVDALRPFSVTDVFANGAPLELEVGSGKGMFLAYAAARQPDRNFLGIELAFRYALHTAARLARAGFENARIMHGDGLRLLRECVPSQSVAAVHVYFPDPWWKKRHKKRRVLNEPFLRDVERVLVPGGRFHFWTDVEEYFQETLVLLQQLPGLSGPLAVAQRPAEHDLDYHTHFERRTRLHGAPVYRCCYDKGTRALS